MSDRWAELKAAGWTTDGVCCWSEGWEQEMTNPTDEQIADALVRAEMLSSRGTGLYSFIVDGFPVRLSITAERAIADGNVAMAAWAAVQERGTYWLSVARGQTLVRQEPGQSYYAEGTDARAITTACAMALRELEEADD